MRAARLFALALQREGLLQDTSSITCELYGSLGATGKGHGSDVAVMLGLMGHAPDTVDVDAVPALIVQTRASQSLMLLGVQRMAFLEKEHLLMYRREAMAEHPNGMKFTARNAQGQDLKSAKYLSVGGGFVVNAGATLDTVLTEYQKVPHPFTSAAELLSICKQTQQSISQVMWDNERTWRSDDEMRAGLQAIWRVMRDCVQRGLSRSGTLPGPYKVQRRAPLLAAQLRERAERTLADPLSVLDWVNVYAFAVNEENAAGGRVVTAPTNGASGVIPAVLHYCDRFVLPQRSHVVADDAHPAVNDFLMTAAAIGMLYKLNASISGAEVGCQGEVGVACSMAAAGLAAVMGGSPEQIENAAEIGMEHNLGLTCDPVGGLVQVPCIERNAMGAVKAINAARMALQGDGQHVVSLDKVIKTMRETGADMKTKYKETSRGGLAVNIVEC
jgi:L-serine dehydratase